MPESETVPVSSSIFDNFKKMVENPVIKKEIKKQDVIASLINSDGWKAVQGEIDKMIKSLESIPIDPTRDTVESVGFRYLASRVTIEYLTALKNLPEREKKIKEKKNG